MKKNKRVLAGILAVFLMVNLLTACEGDKISGGVRLAHGEIKENSIVISVGDTGVRYSEVLGYCYLLKAQYEGNFGKKIWKYKLTDKNTIEDEAKEEIINMITQLKIISATAGEENVSLTNDERDEVLQRAEEVMESATDADKKKYHLSVQGISDIYEENALANKMFYISTDAADTEVSEEEARQVKLEFIKILTKGTTKSGAVVSLDEKEMGAARERANRLRDGAVKAETFLDFAKENSESETVEMTIGQDNTELDRSVVTAAFSMKKGSISPVIGTPDGYYILHCVDDNDEDATYAKREEIIEERQTEMFKQRYRQWLGDCQVGISKSFWEIFEI